MEYTGDTQVLQGSSATVSLALSDTADLSGTTVTIYLSDGSKLVDTAAAAGGQYTLTPVQTAWLNVLRLEWSFTYQGQPWTANTYVEVVGAWLFTVDEARNFDQKQFTSAVSYPDAAIAEARTRILDNFQQICGVAFVPRYALKQIHSNWREFELLLPDLLASKLISLEFWTGNSWEAQDINRYYVTPEGCLTSYSCTTFPRRVQVGYEHGYSQPPPQIKRAALQVLVSELLPSNLPDRALSWNVGGSQYTLSVANGDNRFYGIPAVDAALQQYRKTTIG